jgi:hypothetical protein
MEVVNVQVCTVVEPTLRLTDSLPAVPLALTTIVFEPPPLEELEEELLDELLEDELLDELPPPDTVPKSM